MKRTQTLESAKRLFDISSVRYVITSYKMDDKAFRLLKDVPINENSAYLYEYLPYPGRFLMFNKVIYVDDTKAAIEKLTDNTIDLRSTLVLIGKDKSSNPPRSTASPSFMRTGLKGGNSGLAGTATLVSYNANKVIIECEAKTDAFLYLSDTWYPGWRAYVDGTKTEIYRADLAFRAVEIPKGSHRVVFRYVPISFYIGLFLTISGIVLCVWLIRRERKNRGANV
jgi:hypothetical protein